MNQKNRIKNLLKYVVLAPSGYNSQPWKFKLENNSLEIFPDYSRARLKTDPDYREFYMSLGSAACNLEIAAKNFGMAYQKSYRIDDKNEKYSIYFEFTNQKVKPINTPLFRAISTRHTNRFPYLDQKIPKTLILKLRSLPLPDSIEFSLVTRPGTITAFSKLIDYSFQLWSREQAMVKELENWLRDDLESSPDGLPTGVINLYKLAINFKYFLRPNTHRSKILPYKSQNLAKNAPALAVISTKKDSVLDWFQAGEFFELLTLTLASYGFTSDFFNYPLSLKKTRSDTAKLLESSYLPQLLFRIGKPTVVPPRTSRRPIADLLIS